MIEYNVLKKWLREMRWTLRRTSIVREYLSLASVLLDSAKQAQAVLYAPQLFDQSAIVFRIAAEYLEESRFREAKCLSQIAVEKAQALVREVERVRRCKKLQIESELEEMLKHLTFLQREYECRRMGGGIDERFKLWLFSSSHELEIVVSLLKAEEFHSCEVHLSHVKALIERFRKEAHRLTLIEQQQVEFRNEGNLLIRDKKVLQNR